MLTRDNIRDAASTLAHHWCQGADEYMNRLGVERLLLAYPEDHRRVLCALVLDHLVNEARTSFEVWLFELAGVED